jgi:hypothetical protein
LKVWAVRCSGFPAFVSLLELPPSADWAVALPGVFPSLLPEVPLQLMSKRVIKINKYPVFLILVLYLKLMVQN